MEITLNHTIIPSKNKIASAEFYENIFNFQFIKEWGPFAVVKVNPSLILLFDTRDRFSKNHYAFKVNDQQFDEILERVKSRSISFGSGPYSSDDGEINNNYGGRGAYFKDPDGHLLEIITKDYEID